VRARAVRVGIRLDQERLVDGTAEARGLIEEARATGETESLETVLIHLDTARFQLGDTSVGEHTREALRICLENGHLQRASIAQVCLGGFAFYTGRWDEAVESFDGGRRSALAVGDVVGAALSSLSLGEVLVDRGALEEADEVLTDAVRVLRVAGSHTYAAYGQVHQARILLARGDLAGAEALAEEVELELVVLGQRVSALEATLVRAEAVSRQGRPAEALDLVDVSADSAKGEGVALAPRVHLERTRALLGLGRADAAAAEAAAGLAVARLYKLPFEEAGLLRLQSDVLDVLGDGAGASEAYAVAQEILDRLLGTSA
jgi:tetratricopeptide (TPR) repeat protein